MKIQARKKHHVHEKITQNWKHVPNAQICAADLVFVVEGKFSAVLYNQSNMLQRSVQYGATCTAGYGQG